MEIAIALAVLIALPVLAYWTQILLTNCLCPFMWEGWYETPDKTSASMFVGLFLMFATTFLHLDCLPLFSAYLGVDTNAQIILAAKIVGLALTYGALILAVCKQNAHLHTRSQPQQAAPAANGTSSKFRPGPELLKIVWGVFCLWFFFSEIGGLYHANEYSDWGTHMSWGDFFRAVLIIQAPIAGLVLIAKGWWPLRAAWASKSKPGS